MPPKNPSFKGTAAKRNKPVKRIEDLRLEVRKKFKDLFKLSEEGGKNQFKRENFLEALKENGLDFIDENIKIIKNSDSYEPKYKEGIKKLFEDNEGGLAKVLKYKQTQKDFTNSLENYFNKKSDENKQDLFESVLGMSQEDINNLFRTEGAGMVEPEMVDPPKVKKPEKLPKVKVTNVSPVAPAEKSDEQKIQEAMKEYKKKVEEAGIDYIQKEFFQWYNKEKTFEEIVDEYSSEEEEGEGEEKETMKQEEQPKPQEPPTMSPDERDVMEEEIKQEQLTEQKKDMPTTKRQPRTNIATFKSKMESIPESRLGTQGKEVNELVDDIEFFLKEFPSQLKSEKTIFNKVDKNNKNDLIKLHTKIATKLKPNISSSSSSSNKKVGIVINAESYIKEQMKKLLEEGVFSNLKPADIVVDAAGTKKDNNEGTKDIGNFEVKETPDGGLSAKREGIYRYLPSENEQPNEGKKKKNNQLKIPKPQERNRATNAISMNKQNPFKRPQKTLKLKYLY
jgi:hypothetical protein